MPKKLRKMPSKTSKVIRVTHVPKDLGVKIGTPLEALWTKVKFESELLIKESENTIVIHKEIIKIAKDKILLEKRK